MIVLPVLFSLLGEGPVRACFPSRASTAKHSTTYITVTAQSQT